MLEARGGGAGGSVGAGGRRGAGGNGGAMAAEGHGHPPVWPSEASDDADADAPSELFAPLLGKWRREDCVLYFGMRSNAKRPPHTAPHPDPLPHQLRPPPDPAIYSGHPLSRAHCNISGCPPSTAIAQHLSSFHGQWCSRNHFNTSRCPPNAATSHVLSSHGQSCSRAHCNTSRCPYLAAKYTRPTGSHAPAPTSAPPGAHPQRLAHRSSVQGQSCSRAHCNTVKCPA